MIWILSAIGLGLGLGIIGYYFSKAAYSLFTLSLTLFVFCSSYIRALTGGGTSNGASMDIPLGEDGTTNIPGAGKLIYRAIDNMGMLPEHVQLSIILFICAFFTARIGTWLYTGVGKKPKKVETKADRKKRILEQYGYKNGLPY